MRYTALACDYDGTIAHHGKVDAETVAALTKFAAGGRALILVTGRELEELKHIFPELPIFNHVVIENGAVLYRPKTDEVQTLCPAPPVTFIARLKAKGV